VLRTSLIVFSQPTILIKIVNQKSVYRPSCGYIRRKINDSLREDENKPFTKLP